MKKSITNKIRKTINCVLKYTLIMQLVTLLNLMIFKNKGKEETLNTLSILWENDTTYITLFGTGIVLVLIFFALFVLVNATYTLKWDE